MYPRELRRMLAAATARRAQAQKQPAAQSTRDSKNWYTLRYCTSAAITRYREYITLLLDRLYSDFVAFEACQERLPEFIKSI
jgi:hypothetical protein